ncbi:fatty acid/phospholipid synthesis protein PlsX [Beggiatoa alba B18LD]|uniref:Phosphate acyltransferase n=1 Tax=Beggiatoa alba B18LD TaxID=395493 RepID=I3CGX2_9GAMM|nr:phosphate acyltransferase PlsX [Beggiatoa alba]EIJ42865.1 fatty acid/phospholipid synthesis protein PlsX [Beggiatoa alba B18LD]
MIPRIALDAMSGDHGVSVIIPAAINVLKEIDDVQLLLVGDETVLEQALGQQPPSILQRLSIVHASQVVAMDEVPSSTLRNKKDSSMRVAINLVKEGRADACVSAGNTGALMAMARYVLKTLPGIDRPAIIAALPTITGYPVHMLDLGANVDSTPEHLFEFAVMGSVLTSAVGNLSNPRVGLLNIGQEEIKGNDKVKETARLLSETNIINYIGFVEGDDIFKGTVDVVVCDGFVGNVSLKTTEGVAKMISHHVKQSFNRNLFTRLVGLVALPVLQKLREKIDPRRYNGASLLGLRGIVVKSHGSADIFSFSCAIKEAIVEVRKNVPAQISSQLAELLSERRHVG